jgi:3-methyladenine DNA glycosylase AlkD
MADDLTATRFIERLEQHQSDEELRKIQRYFKTDAGDYGEGDVFMGVRMGQVFQIAKEFIDMPVDELERLLESPIHEVRAGAMSIMDKAGRRNRTTEERRKEMYDLYLRRHDRINNWDLVDLGAPFVVGRYLFERPRQPLYRLARSKSLWERRTAIVSTAYFIRQGDLDDTFAIAEVLLEDGEDMIQKPVGGWLRAAGGSDRPRLLEFLDRHAARMPRTALRYAMEHLEPAQREHYRGLRPG